MLCTSGCASTSEIENQASRHDKASEYYDSIGQPDVAKQESREAQNKRDSANDAIPLLFELFNLFSKKDD